MQACGPPSLLRPPRVRRHGGQIGATVDNLRSVDDARECWQMNTGLPTVARPKGERGLVDQSSARWNRMLSWLTRIDTIRSTRGSPTFRPRRASPSACGRAAPSRSARGCSGTPKRVDPMAAFRPYRSARGVLNHFIRPRMTTLTSTCTESPGRSFSNSFSCFGRRRRVFSADRHATDDQTGNAG